MKSLRILTCGFVIFLLTVLPSIGATLLPSGELCLQATTPTSGAGGTGSGMVGVLGTITAGTGGTAGTYGGIALTGGSGTQATANIVVSGGGVTSVTILNPGTQYVVADTLSAASGNIGGTTGFSVPVSSVAINSALAGGSVGYYVPSTLTTKQTWQDAGQTTLNTNPVTLDANGCAIVYGSGSYRMIVKDSLGNTVFDKLTADTSGGGSLWSGSAGGTANSITVTQGSFSNTAGQILLFVSTATNTGATTITVSSGAAINIFKHAPVGIVALTGGEIVLGHAVELLYNGTQFEILNQFPLFGTSQNVNSATTTDLNLAPSHNASITGTTTITSFGSNADVNYPFYFLRFNGALTLTYSSALVLPGGQNITTANTDTAIAQYFGSGIWQIVSYTRVNIPPIGLAPTVQRFITGGPLNYTPTPGTVRIRVRMIGGGGGGGARATNAGGTGGTTTFGSWTAIGGTGGAANGGAGGAGGTGGATGTGTLIERLDGGDGAGAHQNNGTAVAFAGAAGGNSVFGGAGAASQANTTGAAAKANSGGGGQGAGGTSSNTGAGGGAGEYVEFWVSSPGVTSYTVGAAGAAGAAGTQAGGAGAAGVILIEEFYF